MRRFPSRIEAQAVTKPFWTIRCVVLAVAFLAANASLAPATTITFTSDSSWLVKNTTPGSGWDTDPSFDTTADGGWIAASVNCVDCNAFGQDSIWYDGEFSTTEQVYLRRTFVLDAPAISGFLIGGVDDDARIWINGNVVYDVFDDFAMLFGPLNITPYLVPGSNLIAVFADDNLGFGNQHAFHAQLSVETANAVPEPMPLLLLGSGLTALVAQKYRRRYPGLVGKLTSASKGRWGIPGPSRLRSPRP